MVVFNMKVLIVIDMQNDFISGSLGTEEAIAIVPNVDKKIKEYISSQNKVIFTRDTHYDNYLQINEGKHLPVVHCVYGTHGWNIPRSLDIVNCEHIDKETFGYLPWHLDGDGCVRQFDEIEICGLCTDICVISNALILKALFPEADITVDASCCAGTTTDNHLAALNMMKMCQINIVGE